MSTAADLVPCPFCGEHPKYLPWCQGDEPQYFWPHQIVHNCPVIGQQICIRNPQNDTEDGVVSLWNTRVTPKPQPSLPPAVEERKITIPEPA